MIYICIACLSAWEKGNAVILEPIMKLEVSVPDEFQVRPIA